MGGLNDIIKLLRHNELFLKQTELTSQLAHLANTQKAWKQNFSQFNMFKEIAKNLSSPKIITGTSLTYFNAIAKGIAVQPKFGIPTSAFDAINSINKQHGQLFESLRNITDILKNNQAFSHLNNLQFALGTVSGQLAATATINNRWNLLDDFEEISNEAVVINERIIDENGITKKSLEEIRDFLNRIELRVNKIDADASLIFWKILAILSFILTVFGEVRNWIPKSNYVTKEEVETIIKHQFSTFESNLKTKKGYRTTNRVCSVMLKPKNKTLILATLPVGFDVIVLQINHKWIYVSFLNPKDHVPQTGWIIKKYLSILK